MKLHNTLTRKVEEFKPISSDQVTIYTCGPTVYERAHIGNLASFIYADTLKRTLKIAFPDHAIKHVMNITDVDDKTIAASRAKYPDLPPMDSLKKLTREYEQLFKDDLVKLGIDTANITFVRATENIDSMQKLIKDLLESGFAYIADDGIYFSIENYKQAGKKYGQLIEITAQSTGQARVKNDEYDKDNIHDFALWKAQKDNEPAWDFEISGRNIIGRPGWHIECSAMSTKFLGQPFDIHTGGVDLKFPHHENEIAQSTANDGDLLARFFFHNEHILVDGKKMSKSLNNFYTLEDVVKKGFDPLAFRLLALQAHYRSQAHFSWENLEGTQNRLRRFYNFSSLRHQLKSNYSGSVDVPLVTMKGSFKEAFENDINSPETLLRFEGFLDDIEKLGLSSSRGLFETFLKDIDELFGLNFSLVADIDQSQKNLIDQRETARVQKDFQKADVLRAKLTEQGLEINDTPHGPIWRRA